MTLRAGTLLEFRTDVAIDASELEIGTLATATTVDDVHADGAVIPANSTLNLMLAAKPNTGAREILCSLTGVFPRGHAYRPAVNANEADNKGALLGSVMAPSKDGLPSQLRDLPFRITARSLLSIKLVNNITLREAK